MHCPKESKYANSTLLKHSQLFWPIFQVGYDDTGKLLAIDCTITEDCGYHGQEANFVGPELQSHLDEGRITLPRIWETMD